MCETGLELTRANRLISRAAFRTMTTTGNERHGYPIPDVETSNILPDGSDAARQLMTRDMREADIGIMSHPSVPVAPADATRGYGDDNSLGGGNWIRQYRDPWPLTEPFKEHRFHRLPFRSHFGLNPSARWLSSSRADTAVSDAPTALSAAKSLLPIQQRRCDGLCQAVPSSRRTERDDRSV